MAGIANDDFLAVHQGDKLHFTISTQPSSVLSANDGIRDSAGKLVHMLNSLSLDSVTSGPSNGNLSRVGPYGGITYKPNDGFVGQDFFTYQISDKAGNTGTALVTIDVTNTAPTAADDSYSVTHDRALVVDRGAGLLANDSDSDGDGLTVQLKTGPSHGTLTRLRANGSFRYQPDAGYVGADAFAYEVFDGAEYASALVAINVMNAAPSAISLSKDRVEEFHRIGTLVGKLTATDVDAGDTHTFSLVSGDGDDDNSSFQIVGTKLKTNAVFDADEKDRFTIRVRAVDEIGAGYEQSLTVTIDSLIDCSCSCLGDSAASEASSLREGDTLPVSFLAHEDAPREGTAENNYHGIGRWTFASFQEMYDYFRRVAIAEGWPWPLRAANQRQIERGCVGLAMFRLGQFKSKLDGGVNFPWEVQGSAIFDNSAAAANYLATMRGSGDGNQYKLVAIQLPGTVTPVRQEREGRINEHHLFYDEISAGRDLNAERQPNVTYNFATWQELDSGGGYWEYMLHSFSWNRLQPWPGDAANQPTVVHSATLPGSATETVTYTTFYGVVPVSARQ